MHGSLPHERGQSVRLQCFYMRVVKIAAPADETVSSHTHSHSFLEKHLDVSEIRPIKRVLTPEQISWKFYHNVFFLSLKCPLFNMKFFCINLLSYASFHQTAELPDLTF